jgi:endonuclease-3
LVDDKQIGNYTEDEMKYIVDELEDIFTRRTFEEMTPYEVLVRTILSQRTRDENTDKASESLFSVYHTMEEVADAPVEDIAELVVKNKEKFPKPDFN